MIKFRATFTDGPEGNISSKYDFEAEDREKAWDIVFAHPNAKKRDIYTDVILEEIEEGPKPISIKFAYDDGRSHAQYYQYMVIRALDEERAVKYYNEHFLGKHFFQPWPTKINDEGSCIYGSVAETAFAACPGYDFDAAI